jgi:hypothetical protein
MAVMHLAFVLSTVGHVLMTYINNAAAVPH